MEKTIHNPYQERLAAAFYCKYITKDKIHYLMVWSEYTPEPLNNGFIELGSGR